MAAKSDYPSRRGTSESPQENPGSYTKALQGGEAVIHKTDSPICSIQGSEEWNPIRNGGTKTPLGAGNSNPL